MIWRAAVADPGASGARSGRITPSGATRPERGSAIGDRDAVRDGSLAVRPHANRLRALELLALGLERRRDHHLGPLEVANVLVAARGHRGPKRSHQVEGAV